MANKKKLPESTNSQQTAPKVAQDSKTRSAGVAPSAGTAEQQMERFAQAYRELRNQKFAQAKELFALAAKGPQPQISHNARLHLLMCDRRLDKQTVQLDSIDDHYNYAIERINARDLPTACSHLQAALAMNSEADHLYYALALCRGLEGDMPGAYENLRRAIELEPRNRVAARQDADFAPLAHQPLFQQLLYPDKSPF